MVVDLMKRYLADTWCGLLKGVGFVGEGIQIGVWYRNVYTLGGVHGSRRVLDESWKTDWKIVVEREGFCF